MQKHPQINGGVFVYVRRCPTFPPEEGSIIGADRLSFRVRDGTGRFPVAVAAVTLFKFVLMGGVVRDIPAVAGLSGVDSGCVSLNVGKFSAG